MFDIYVHTKLHTPHPSGVTRYCDHMERWIGCGFQGGAIMLFFILQNKYFNKFFIFLENLLPYTISGPSIDLSDDRVSPTSQVLTFGTSLLPQSSLSSSSWIRPFRLSCWWLFFVVLLRFITKYIKLKNVEIGLASGVIKSVSHFVHFDQLVQKYKGTANKCTEWWFLSQVSH
jgi:hypothetical protein